MMIVRNMRSEDEYGVVLVLRMSRWVNRGDSTVIPVVLGERGDAMIGAGIVCRLSATGVI